MVEIPSAYQGTYSVNNFMVVWRIHYDTDVCYFCVGFSVCLVLFVCLGEFIIVDGVDLLNCRGVLSFINQLT